LVAALLIIVIPKSTATQLFQHM